MRAVDQETKLSEELKALLQYKPKGDRTMETRTETYQIRNGDLLTTITVKQEALSNERNIHSMETPKPSLNQPDFQTVEKLEFKATIRDVAKIAGKTGEPTLRWEYCLHDTGELVSQFTAMAGEKKGFLSFILTKLISQQVDDDTDLLNYNWKQFVGRKVVVVIQPVGDKKVARLTSVLD